MLKPSQPGPWAFESVCVCGWLGRYIHIVDRIGGEEKRFLFTDVITLSHIIQYNNNIICVVYGAHLKDYDM